MALSVSGGILIYTAILFYVHLFGGLNNNDNW